MSSLYIHIPFCLQKCRYCDFFSRDNFAPQQLEDYLQSLLLEATQLARTEPARTPLQTIFFGGGTPSLLEARQIAQLLETLQHQFGVTADCEISLEANPGTLSLEKLRGYRQAGINRLSIGVQTLNDSQLQRLGRVHSATEGKQAVQLARQAGFENLSLDLIFALPGQTLEQLEQDVEQLLALQPEHLSLYGLSFEPGTPLEQQRRQGQLQEPDEQLYADGYRLIDRRLTAADFEHYEISNFARPGFRCRHNQVYWRRQACLALGCGAHSFRATGYGERWQVPPDLERYRNKLRHGEPAHEQLESFDRATAMAETAYLALRTKDGLSRDRFQRQFASWPEEIFPEAFRRNADRLQLQHNCWHFDLTGWLLYDHLICDFL